MFKVAVKGLMALATAHRLCVRSLIGSERTILQWTVTPLIRGDITALSGQPGGHYYHSPYHKFTFRGIVFLLIMCTTHGLVLSVQPMIFIL